MLKFGFHVNILLGYKNTTDFNTQINKMHFLKFRNNVVTQNNLHMWEVTYSLDPTCTDLD